MSDYAVRQARPEEMAQLAAMRERLGRHLKQHDPGIWELSSEEMAHQAERYSDVAASGKGCVLVAVDGADRPVGMIVVRLLENPRIEPGRFGRVDDAWVEPGHRRHGLMRRLIAAAAEYCEQNGFDRVMLDWSVKNVPSARCWRGIGFRPLVVVGMAGTGDLRRQ
jgi:ribosomal protein S18 acetylase RimI-like enzyme